MIKCQEEIVRKGLYNRVWQVSQYCWNLEHNKAEKVFLLVEADSCSEAAKLSGEGDGIHEIESIQCVGPIVVRQKKIIEEINEQNKQNKERIGIESPKS